MNRRIFKILSFILILGGLIAGLYLISNRQIFKSKAAANISDAFEITNDKGNQIFCMDNVCTTHSLNINLKIKDPAVFNP